MTTLAYSEYSADDEDLLGKQRGYPLGTKENCFFDESLFVGSFTNIDKIFPTRTLPRPAVPRELKAGRLDPAFRFRIPTLTANGVTFGEQEFSMDDYLKRHRLTSLLILKDDAILFERYQYDRQPDQRFISFSMAKSITSLAVGCALEEEKIASLDDRIDRYVPEMAGYIYGETTIRNMLRMASGVRFSEDYGGADDLKRFLRICEEQGVLVALQSFNEREAPQGMRFHYATSETCLLGLLVTRATGTTLADYVAEKIWRPMGAESDAKWIVDMLGVEHAGSGFNAVLRDYGRLGMLLANDGMRDGVQILPKSYLIEATDWRRHPPAFHPRQATPVFGYGYQFWLSPSETRRFSMVGVRGQVIYVDTASKLVLVQTSADKHADFYTHGTLGQELGGVWLALLKTYGAL